MLDCVSVVEFIGKLIELPFGCVEMMDVFLLGKIRSRNCDMDSLAVWLPGCWRFQHKLGYRPIPLFGYHLSFILILTF